jgi:hypothetical protein
VVQGGYQPWTETENIVFGVCLLGCDALYERGLVSVAAKGRIYVSNPSTSTRSLATFLAAPQAAQVCRLAGVQR